MNCFAYFGNFSCCSFITLDICCCDGLDVLNRIMSFASSPDCSRRSCMILGSHCRRLEIVGHSSPFQDIIPPYQNKWSDGEWVAPWKIVLHPELKATSLTQCEAVTGPTAIHLSYCHCVAWCRKSFSTYHSCRRKVWRLKEHEKRPGIALDCK